MNKMQMAQDYIIAEVRRVGVCSIDEDKIADAWKIADAMQAEADEREDKTRPQVLEEWQPDWSQAPEWAKYWMIASNGAADWLSDHPSGDPLKVKICHAPSFNYQGNWKNSLRKRPQ